MITSDERNLHRKRLQQIEVEVGLVLTVCILALCALVTAGVLVEFSPPLIFGIILFMVMGGIFLYWNNRD